MSTDHASVIAGILEERAAYFDGTTGHFSREDAARSYRATAAQIAKALAARADFTGHAALGTEGWKLALAPSALGEAIKALEEFEGGIDVHSDAAYRAAEVVRAYLGAIPVPANATDEAPLSTDLVERLREESQYLSQARDFRGPLSVVVSLSDAATALESLQSDIERRDNAIQRLQAENNDDMDLVDAAGCIWYEDADGKRYLGNDRAEAAESDVERLTAERDEARDLLNDFDSGASDEYATIRGYLGVARGRANAAEASLAAERRRVEELETTLRTIGLFPITDKARNQDATNMSLIALRFLQDGAPPAALAVKQEG